MTDFSSSHPLVLGVGAATWDRFVLVPEFSSDEGVTFAGQTREQGGGPVATALSTLAALGVRTALLDAQAGDVIGRTILRDLKRRGVDVSFVRIHEHGASALAHILVRERDGARHIFYTPATCTELSVEDLPEELIQGATVLHLNGRHEKVAFRAAKLAGEAGVTVSFDGGAGRYRDSIRDLVRASDLRIVAKDFALKFAGTGSMEEAARVLRADSPQLVVITDGVLGSWVWPQEGEGFHQEAVRVSPVVDTTGCGDVFHGAFLYGWMKRWPLRETAAFAAKLAAWNALGLGGRHVLDSLSTGAGVG